MQMNLRSSANNAKGRYLKRPFISGDEIWGLETMMFLSTNVYRLICVVKRPGCPIFKITSGVCETSFSIYEIIMVSCCSQQSVPRKKKVA